MTASVTHATTAAGMSAHTGSMSTEEIKARIAAMFDRDEAEPERTSR